MFLGGELVLGWGGCVLVGKGGRGKEAEFDSECVSW